MNYASIRTCDIANGEGVRVSLFVSGCTHGCKGCFNEEAQSFDYGEPFTGEVEDMVIAALKPDFIAGLTLLGGEPMEPENQRALIDGMRYFAFALVSKDKSSAHLTAYRRLVIPNGETHRIVMQGLDSSKLYYSPELGVILHGSTLMSVGIPIKYKNADFSAVTITFEEK